MTEKQYEDQPPDKHHLTSYDEAHLVDYLRLLDAQAEGAPWRLREKLYEYCSSDVRLLSNAMCLFLRQCYEFQLKLFNYYNVGEELLCHPFAENIITVSGMYMLLTVCVQSITVYIISSCYSPQHGFSIFSRV